MRAQFSHGVLQPFELVAIGGVGHQLDCQLGTPDQQMGQPGIGRFGELLKPVGQGGHVVLSRKRMSAGTSQLYP